MTHLPKTLAHEELKALMKTPTAREILGRRAPGLRVYHYQKWSSGRHYTGRAWSHEGQRRLSVRYGKEVTRAQLFMLLAHELAHVIAPAREHHGDLWRSIYVNLIRERWGTDATFNTRQSYFKLDLDIAAFIETKLLTNVARDLQEETTMTEDSPKTEPASRKTNRAAQATSSAPGTDAQDRRWRAEAATARATSNRSIMPETLTPHEMLLFVDPEHRPTIQRWLERGDGVAVYRNAAIGSARMGHRQFVSYGSAEAQIEEAEPPQRMPDIGSSINWQYQLEALVPKGTRND